MPNDPSKTETATPKQRKKARDEGNVPKSQEISKGFILLAGLVGLVFWMRYISADMQELFAHFMSSSMDFVVTKQSVYDLAIMVSYRIARMVLPVILIVGAMAFIIMRLQVGALWTTKVFEPKLEKHFNLPKNMQKIFISQQTLVNLVKNILMAVAIGFAPYLVLKGEIDTLPVLFYKDALGLAVYMLETGTKMVIYALLPLVAISIGDLIYTRWQYEDNLKMSKDEVKDERKQAEGDPEVKSKQKQKMQKVMMRRMLADVPKADVVITNPTHYAIALSYNPMEAPAPVVLAKGVNRVAEKIKEVARENGVPIRENKPLARALYKSVEIGETIPEELYQAVASILAQLHKYRTRPGAN